MRFFLSFIMLSIFLLSACKDTENSPEGFGSLNLEVANLMDGSPIVFNTQTYQSANGDRFTIEEFRFYLSKVTLKNEATGAVYEVPDSYHLVTPTAQNHVFSISLTDIPAGNYDVLEFGIGVDAAVNKSIDQLGDLDPSNNMAWDWNTGYKFILLEGKVETDTDPIGLVYHVGTDANYRTISLSLPQTLTVQKDLTSTIQVEAEVSEIMDNPNVMDLQQNNVIMFQDISSKVAENYAQGMFSVAFVN